MDKSEIRTYTNRLYVEMQIDEMLPLEQYQIFIKENFATASWRFSDNKHQIVIGRDIFKNTNKILTKTEQIKYLRAYLYHELAHSMYTDRDIKGINEILMFEGMAFEIFNLFEDARIEEKMRQTTKRPFNWLNYEDIPIPEDPLQLFFYILQAEHKQKELKTVKHYIETISDDDFNTVLKMYVRVLKCKNSMEVIEVLKAWYLIFPDTPMHFKDIKGYEYLFTLESDLLLNEEKFDALIDGEEDLLLLVANDKNSKKKVKIAVNSEGSREETLLSKEPVEVAFDKDKRDLLLKKMQKLFLVQHKTEASTIPSKKLNIKRLATGTDKRYRRKSILAMQKKKITIIFDLSASMYDSMDNMRLLLDVLDKMAVANIIDATLILTAMKINAVHEIIPMPLPKNTIDRLIPKYGGEGLNSTMNMNINLLSQSDYIWIFTDGYIDDKTLDKNFFHSKNIVTHAMYIGSESCRREMELSFDYVICEKDVEGLAQKIFGLVK